MSTNFIDVLMMWLGSGPSAPKYCQVVGPNATRRVQFGDDVAGMPADHMVLDLNVIGAKVAVPANALLWRVPDLAGTSLTDEEKDALRAAWPPLRHLSGAAFTPEEAGPGGGLDAVLLEVFPPAFRRLEYLVSSLEIPDAVGDWDIPRAPAPRWFWIRGFGETGLRQALEAIAAKQWLPRPAPGIARTLKGLAPIYVDAGETLATLEDDDSIEIRAFDATGLPIDPDFVFDVFNRLAADSDFTRLKVEHPEATALPYQAADRQVIVFCDQDGRPYTPRPAPSVPLPPFDPEAGAIEAERVLLLVAPQAGSHSFPAHGVLVLPGGAGGLSGRVGLAMTGTHVRLGQHPNGDLGATITVEFAPRMFLRLRVLDYADWFARNANPRNRLARYSEGNLVTPLVDGAAFFHEMFRTLRGTYKEIDSDQPPAAFDPYAPLADAPADGVAKARIHIANAWITPDTPMLGRRGLIDVPRTQAEAPEELPSVDALFARMRFSAAHGLPGLVDLPASKPDEMQWWLVSEEGALPPGACVELRQLHFADDFRGDDPRLPGTQLNADLFGIVAPYPGSAASARGFVGATGRFALPVVFALGREPFATLRITLWTPGTDAPRMRSYGQVSLPSPADPLARPAPEPAIDAARLRLVHDGTPGTVDVVLEPGALSAARAVVVLNARSGEAVVADHAANAGPGDPPIRIRLAGFALKDSALVGFLPTGDRTVEACTGFFELSLGRPAIASSGPPHPGEAAVAALQAGAAPAHPTEIAGLLREAIIAGVDVRLLAWRDPYQDPAGRLGSSLGTVNAVNAVVGGRRGQAIWDATGRETFHVHHQKGAFVRGADGRVAAFLGGIDLVASRWDTPAHRQPDAERHGSTWHDVQCRIEGRAAWDVYRNIMQRWNAAHALPDVVGADPGRTPMPPPDDPAWGPTPVVEDPLVTRADGPHAVQIMRTLAPRLDAYGGSVSPFDIVDPATGDLSVRDGWSALLAVAERHLYIEDQYFWVRPHALALNAWLRARPERFLFLVLPRRFSDLNIADQIHYALRRRALNLLLFGVADVAPGIDTATLPGNVEKQVALFHIRSRENADPIYVHSKLAIADDTWFMIGSANVTRRSLTFDSELGAACIDARLRRGGHLGARALRIDLLAEHLALTPVERPLLEDPRDAFRLVVDVLAGRRPWMRTHLMKADLAFTHYGPFPEDFDPTFLDVVDLLVDTDGTTGRLEPRLVDAYAMFQSLGEAQGGLTFGGVGRLRFAFDVTGLGRPADRTTVAVDVFEQGRPVTRITMGPWPATAPVDAGILHIGTTYVVRATARDLSSGAPLATTADIPVPTSDFITLVTIAF